MGAAPGVRVEGGRVFLSSLDDAARVLADLPDAGTATGRLLVEAAAQAAPRETGTLAASHAFTVTGGVVTVNASAPYAAAVHARTPWLAEDLERNTEQVLNIYTAAVSDTVGSIRGS